MDDNEKKLKLELRKLELDIERESRSPLKRTSFWGGLTAPIISVGTLVFLIFNGNFSLTRREIALDIKDLESRRKDIRKSIDSLNNSIDSLNTSITTLKTDNSELASVNSVLYDSLKGQQIRLALIGNVIASKNKLISRKDSTLIEINKKLQAELSVRFQNEQELYEANRKLGSYVRMTQDSLRDLDTRVRIRDAEIKILKDSLNKKE